MWVVREKGKDLRKQRWESVEAIEGAKRREKVGKKKVENEVKEELFGI